MADRLLHLKWDFPPDFIKLFLSSGERFLDRICRIIRISFGRSPEENGQTLSPAASIACFHEMSWLF
jgi:hypothetical protein